MDLALISMPWAIFNRPSIQLACLQAYVEERLPEVRCTSLHPYLEVAAALGLETYRRIAAAPWAAEALYSGLLFSRQRQAAAGVFHQSMAREPVPSYDSLLDVLEQAMEQWLARQDFSTCSLIGFSVCFSQLPSSLYAAQEIKKKYPGIRMVFGGSTCTPALGRSLLSLFSELDYIITGEGEQPLVELLNHCRAQTPLHSGTVLRRNKQKPPPATAAKNMEIPDLADLPVPDYGDYFQQMKACSLDFTPVLPLEFSRGCWWNKCSFCNLNLQWQGYRFKKHDQVLNELSTMIHRYQALDFTFTDNALPPGEADRFFTATAGAKPDLRFFGEIRTLKKAATYQLYSRGGLKSVQVGIEAFSDSLLAMMCKGTTVMDNLAAMKFALEAGMELDGNLILEFPGSTKTQVEETLAILDLVLPFRPLAGAGFFLGHGSPVCERAKQYGIKAIVQHPLNKKLYPPELLKNMDMLIKSYRGDRMQQKKIWQPVREKIDTWHEFHRQRSNPALPVLSWREGGNFIIIRQERPDSPPLHHRLKGLSRKIYLACCEPIRYEELLRQFPKISESQLSAFVRELEEKKLMYCSSEACLSLAVRQTG